MKRRAIVTFFGFILTLIGVFTIGFVGPQHSSSFAQDATPTEEAAGEEDLENEFTKLENFNPANFDNPTTIDNEWFPLKPGTQYVYEGVTMEDGELIPHRVVFTVTDLTKVIAGVRVVVVWDTDYSQDLLEESELTFFAQDNDGNVWHLGQYRETYSETEFVGGRIWIEGAPEGSRAGIMMPANPQVGMPSYSEGYAPAPFNWTDRGRVYQMGETVTGPLGTFDDVLVIEEYNQEEPGAFQLKYYARGIGIVYIGWRGDDQQQETMDLIEVRQLTPEEMAEARAEALALESRAYIYSYTEPAE